MRNCENLWHAHVGPPSPSGVLCCPAVQCCWKLCRHKPQVSTLCLLATKRAQHPSHRRTNPQSLPFHRLGCTVVGMWLSSGLLRCYQRLSGRSRYRGQHWPPNAWITCPGNLSYSLRTHTSSVNLTSLSCDKTLRSLSLCSVCVAPQMSTASFQAHQDIGMYLWKGFVEWDSKARRQ